MRIYNYDGSSSTITSGRTRSSAAGIAKIDNLREQSNDPVAALKKRIESLPADKAKPLLEKLDKMRESVNDPLASLRNQIDTLSLGNSQSLSYTPTYTRTLLNMGFKTLPR